MEYSFRDTELMLEACMEFAETRNWYEVDVRTGELEDVWEEMTYSQKYLLEQLEYMLEKAYNRGEYSETVWRMRRAELGIC